VVVQSGQSLFKIAQREYGNGNEWPAIWQANMAKVPNPNLVFAGQKLVIPRTGTTFDSQEPDGAVTVTVHAGDTLASIAQSRLGNANTWPTLWHLYQAQVPNPSLIFAGQVLKI
jgi:nucleoid-associated protein YgaU